VTFTYDTSLANDLAKVRLALGDTTTSDPLFSDEEISGALGIYGSPLQTAAALADAQAAKYSRFAAMSIDGASVQYNQRADMFRALATRLRTQAVTADSGGLGSPFVGGTSKADMDTERQDTDREPNRFEVGQMDFPGTALPYSRDFIDDATS